MKRSIMSFNDIRKHSLTKHERKRRRKFFIFNIHSEFSLWTIIFQVLFPTRGKGNPEQQRRRNNIFQDFNEPRTLAEFLRQFGDRTVVLSLCT